MLIRRLVAEIAITRRGKLLGAENAGVEKSGVDSRGGKCRSGKCRSDNG